MSEEVFCDSSLLTQIYYIIYAEPYLYASCVVFDSDIASNIIKIDSNGNASVLYTFGNADIYASLAYVDGYIFAPLLTRLYQISTTGTNYNIYYNIFPANNATAITYLNNYLYVVTASTTTAGSDPSGSDAGSGSTNAVMYKVPFNNLNPTTVITTFPYNIIPLSITNDSTYLYVNCNNNFNDTSTIYVLNVSGQILYTNFIIGTPPIYFYNCLFYSNYFYISETNGIYGVRQYNAEGDLINANFATGGSNIVDFDGNGAYYGGGFTFDNQGNMYLSSQTSGTTSVINIIKGAATPPAPTYNISFGGDSLISYQFLKVKNVKNDFLIKYNKNPLYNTLMESHKLIKAHNMLCDTLSPKDIITDLFRKNFTKKVFSDTVVKLNRNNKPSNLKKNNKSSNLKKNNKPNNYGQLKKILRNLYKNINNY